MRVQQIDDGTSDDSKRVRLSVDTAGRPYGPPLLMCYNDDDDDDGGDDATG